MVCKGNRPPPCEKFTFNRIDRLRALLIGGKQRKFGPGFNTLYLFDLETLVSSVPCFHSLFNKYGSLQTWDGPNGPKVADQKWPDGRGLHSVACLVDPESDLAASSQRVVVFWGEGIEAKILNDIWILSVSAMSWMQVCNIIKS